MAKHTVLAASLALSCIAGSHEGGAARPTEPLVVNAEESLPLRIGESAKAEEAKLTITFQEVSSDSRCPKDVNCIQAGEAVVVLALTSEDGKTTLLELAVPPGGASPARDVNGFRIAVVELDPQTESTKSIDPASYVATIRVSPS